MKEKDAVVSVFAQFESPLCLKMQYHIVCLENELQRGWVFLLVHHSVEFFAETIMELRSDLNQQCELLEDANEIVVNQKRSSSFSLFRSKNWRINAYDCRTN